MRFLATKRHENAQKKREVRGNVSTAGNDSSVFDRYDGLYAEISRQLAPYAVDLLIYTEAELAALSSRTFIQTILQEGVVIYESKTTAP